MPLSLSVILTKRPRTTRRHAGFTTIWVDGRRLLAGVGSAVLLDPGIKAVSGRAESLRSISYRIASLRDLFNRFLLERVCVSLAFHKYLS